jgi:lipid II:glycine glycyltransferase (peptidoglycan interpeptide bridge formation enzyme)
MQNLKHLPPQITREQIVSLLGTFGDQCVLVRCDDAQGRLLALRGALTLGTKGWDTLAAATLEARKVYASHATFWELMRVCAERGVAWYDMGGIDPVRNRGVYDFKNGTGAAPLNYLGEWERASPTWLAPLAGRLVAWRSRGI